MNVWIMERYCTVKKRWEPMNVVDEEEHLIRDMWEGYTNPKIKKHRRVRKYVRMPHPEPQAETC